MPLTGPKAFYFPPSGDGSRGGTFFVNVTDPSAWGTFELEAMAFHEGIPGHHLQLAIAAELGDDVPEFRKHLHNAAYAEGTSGWDGDPTAYVRVLSEQ